MLSFVLNKVFNRII